MVQARAEQSASPPTRRWGEYVGLSAGSAALMVGAVLTAWVLAGVFSTAHRTFGWIAACAVVALLIDPLVAAVDRHLPRILAVISVLLAVLAFVAVIGAGIIREVSDSLDELSVGAPQAAGELEDRYDWAAELELERRVTAGVEDLQERVREGAVTEATDALPTYLVTSILMLFLLAGGRRYIEGFLAQFSEPRRTRWRRVIVEGGRRGRTWILGALGLALLAGTIVGGCAWLLDLPAAVSVGVLVGLLSALPLIGVLVGGVPAVLLAFGLQGWGAGVVVVVVLLVLQVLEATLARPALERRSVHVGPTVPLLVGLLGFELYGLGGAIYGVALAVIVLAALDVAGQERDDSEEGLPAVRPATSAP